MTLDKTMAAVKANDLYDGHMKMSLRKITSQKQAILAIRNISKETNFVVAFKEFNFFCKKLFKIFQKNYRKKILLKLQFTEKGDTLTFSSTGERGALGMREERTKLSFDLTLSTRGRWKRQSKKLQKKIGKKV